MAGTIVVCAVPRCNWKATTVVERRRAAREKDAAFDVCSACASDLVAKGYRTVSA